MQALHLLALNPIAETLGDPNSYGYRLGRCVADAWGECFIALGRRHSPRWVFEGDIEACFDRISHTWLLENIPMDRKVLREWLEAGYLEEATFHPTPGGTPQGGIISPVIANLALDGLETAAKSAVPSRTKYGRSKVHVIRYADDFVITAATREMLEEHVLPSVERFLAERGLRLSPEKSKITHIPSGLRFPWSPCKEVRPQASDEAIQGESAALSHESQEFRARAPCHRHGEPHRGAESTDSRLDQPLSLPRLQSSFYLLDDDLYWSVRRWARRRPPIKVDGMGETEVLLGGLAVVRSSRRRRRTHPLSGACFRRWACASWVSCERVTRRSGDT